ncbi:hypothetical protein PoB_002664600 [Plakobranchus ocellatus]|uniref:Uncharacterized protein n=1 Tax=Plakobranchus ocellatus TaxID=259542 RepID=A0AAV3ZW41_9GAST|nr:hypothetical protein PoB_002664600 [Plakobranchus ocellatus]
MFDEVRERKGQGLKSKETESGDSRAMAALPGSCQTKSIVHPAVAVAMIVYDVPSLHSQVCVRPSVQCTPRSPT